MNSGLKEGMVEVLLDRNLSPTLPMCGKYSYCLYNQTTAVLLYQPSLVGVITVSLLSDPSPPMLLNSVSLREHTDSLMKNVCVLRRGRDWNSPQSQCEAIETDSCTTLKDSEKQ